MMITNSNEIIKSFSVFRCKKMWSSLKGCRISATLRRYSEVNEEFIKDWNKIDWKKVETRIKDLQEKIVIATMKKNMKEVYRLQWVILQSYEGRACAVRRVVMNKGGMTEGTDGIVWWGPKDYSRSVKELLEIVKNPGEYKAQPFRRVLIPKPGKKEKRPLGIPTMIDRALQALYHLGIDPVVETKSDPNSYGFRKFRSTQDAITAIRSHLDKKTHPEWILEADIPKCFDKIDHGFLMRHTPIIHKKVLEQWLKCGAIENMKHIDTTEGTPQGGIISPVLCNIALNGLEKVIKENNPNKRGISQGVHVIRYADDIIITAKTREIAEKNRQILSEFLAERGLRLNEKKTVITHINSGFDFLGFNIRRMKWNPRFNNPTNQDTILIIKPSRKGIKKLTETIKKIITPKKPLQGIITEINPILRGWGEHKRISYHSQATFIKIDHWIWKKMMRWVKRQNNYRSTRANRYLVRTQNRKWNWGTSKTRRILNLGEITTIILRPLKLDRNPYLKDNMEYFNKRKERTLSAKFKLEVLKKHKNICPVCNESLHNGESVELHHIVPQRLKGKYNLTNIQPLHAMCHRQTTYQGNIKEIQNSSEMPEDVD